MKILGFTLPFALTAMAGSYLNSPTTPTSGNNNGDTVEFQTFSLDGEIDNMFWCGAQDEVILVKTTDGSIYRSRDRGSNWKRLKSLMTKQGQTVADQN
jgi:hypothetical protein